MASKLAGDIVGIGYAFYDKDGYELSTDIVETRIFTSTEVQTLETQVLCLPNAAVSFLVGLRIKPTRAATYYFDDLTVSLWN